MHHYVAGGGGFDWAGDHAAAAGVGRELAELAIFCAAADDMDRLDPAAGQLFAHAQHLAEFYGQAFQGTSQHCALFLGHGLAGPFAIAADCFGHVAGGEKFGCVGIDERAQRRLRCGQLVKIFPSKIIARLVPHAAAFLHQPQTGDIFQQPGSSAHAAFVGEIPILTPDRSRPAWAIRCPSRPKCQG